MSIFLALLARLSVPTEPAPTLPSPTRNYDWQQILDDPPLARFRLDKLEGQLRRMLKNSDLGDEPQQLKLLTEVRRLRRVLDLPDVDMDAFREPEPPRKEQPRPRHPPPARGAPTKWRSFAFAGAALAAAGGWGVVLHKRKKARRSDRVPEVLLPRPG
jgi:hypothetical protein